jgi:hypothetical protein
VEEELNNIIIDITYLLNIILVRYDSEEIGGIHTQLLSHLLFELTQYGLSLHILQLRLHVGSAPITQDEVGFHYLTFINQLHTLLEV